MKNKQISNKSQDLNIVSKILTEQSNRKDFQNMNQYNLFDDYVTYHH